MPFSEQRPSKYTSIRESVYHAIFQMAADAIVLIDAKTLCFAEVNPAACELLGYSRNELLGQSLTLIDIDRSRAEIQRLADKILARGVFRFNKRQRCKNGRILDIQVHARVLHFDDSIFFISIWRDISKQTQKKRALKASEAKFRNFIENNTAVMLLLDPVSGVIKEANQAAVDFYGYPHNILVGMNIDQINSLPNKQLEELKKSAVEAKEGMCFTVPHRLASGDLRWMEVHSTPIEKNGYTLLFSILHDVTERQKTIGKLEESEQAFRRLFEDAANPIILFDPESGKIIDCNRATIRFLHYNQKSDLIGQSPSLFVPSMRDPDSKSHNVVHNSIKQALEKGSVSFDCQPETRDGCRLDVEVALTALVYHGQRIIHSLWIDISARKAAQRQLEHLAHYDALTHLPNRVLFHDRLEQAMRQAQRDHHFLAVIYLDLDGFKAINDQFGHEAGDLYLIKVAQDLQAVLRDSDTVARIGGDEFVLIFPDLERTEDCQHLLERLLAAVSFSTEQDNYQFPVSASIGVSFFPQADKMDADQLIRQADQAMYQAKLAGKNQYHIFNPEHDLHLRKKHQSLKEIRYGLKQNEFVLFYQPKVNMLSGKVIGAEALIRWQHPQQGLLPPSSFLPCVEDHILSIDMGEWVIESALAQMQDWMTQGVELPVSVNIGARQLQQDTFPEKLWNILSEYPDIPPAWLTLEVLESSALSDIVLVSDIIIECRQLGVKFALDDFGTGYSSLTYLKRLKVDQLKIDQSFVQNVLHDEDDQAILQGIIGLASAFRREIIAEGVETELHGIQLIHLDCELAQGYGIAKPMPADQVLSWIESWKPYPSWASRV